MSKKSHLIRLTNLPILFDSLDIESLPDATQAKIARIDACLPQTQCGLCDHADGCLPYAVAIVIENEPYWTTTGDGESVRRYRQIGEYTVDNKKITLTITDQKTDPVPEGTKITLWVNPDNPYNFINSREINLIDIVVPIAIPIGIMLFGVLGLVFNLKKEK